MFHRGWWLYECSFTWKQKADTKTWVRVLYWGGNTGKEEWGSMAIETGKKAEVDKAISGVHEDLIPIKTSGYVNYLLCLSICITRGVRAFVPRHSSCSVNIFFSWLHFKKCHLLRLFFFGQGCCGYWLQILSRLDFLLLSLRNFMYEVEDFIQRNTGTTFKRTVVRMGEKCSNRGHGWSERGGYVGELGQDEKEELNRTQHSGKGNLQRWGLQDEIKTLKGERGV